MRFVISLLSNLKFIKLFLDFVFHKIEEFKKEREERRVKEFKEKTKEEVQNGDIKNINDKLKF